VHIVWPGLDQNHAALSAWRQPPEFLETAWKNVEQLEARIDEVTMRLRLT
jgi:hypothetical protein